MAGGIPRSMMAIEIDLFGLQCFLNLINMLFTQLGMVRAPIFTEAPFIHKVVI
jgi:hypothetical protein